MRSFLVFTLVVVVFSPPVLAEREDQELDELLARIRDAEIGEAKRRDALNRVLDKYFGRERTGHAWERRRRRVCAALGATLPGNCGDFGLSLFDSRYYSGMTLTRRRQLLPVYARLAGDKTWGDHAGTILRLLLRDGAWPLLLEGTVSSLNTMRMIGLVENSKRKWDPAQSPEELQHELWGLLRTEKGGRVLATWLKVLRQRLRTDKIAPPLGVGRRVARLVTDKTLGFEPWREAYLVVWRLCDPKSDSLPEVQMSDRNKLTESVKNWQMQLAE